MELIGQSPAARSHAIKALGRQLGFDDVGVAPAAAGPEMDRFNQWLEAGYHGEMTYMFRHRRRRADPNRTVRGVHSVIVAALDYDTPHPRSIDTPKDPTRAWISRYAWGDDYHEVLEPMLQDWCTQLSDAAPDHTFMHYVDHGPVLEKVFAARAGLGWQGKHTNIINSSRGSYFFLATILTTLELEPDSPVVDHCGSCTACLDACPTQAFPQPYQLDARKCLSYLNIELEGPIPEPERAHVGEQLYGCDICQDVCPWNRKPEPKGRPEFQPRPGLMNPRLSDIEALTEESFQATFAGSPVERRGLLGLAATARAIRETREP